MQKKSEHFINQGYDKELVLFLESCGVKKYMLWFLVNFKKHNFMFHKDKIIVDVTLSRNNDSFSFNREIISLINDYILTIASDITHEDILTIYREAFEVKKLNEKLKKNILHKFEDGYYVVNLPIESLNQEGTMMNNCIKYNNNYVNGIKRKEFAILALKKTKP